MSNYITTCPWLHWKSNPSFKLLFLFLDQWGIARQQNLWMKCRFFVLWLSETLPCKKMCFDRRLGTKHLQPESACVDGFGIAKQEPLGEVLEVTLKTSPGMLVSSILASPASKEEFNYILYNKDYQNAGTTCFPRFCCHWHYTIMQAASRTTANGSGTPPPLVPELCSPCLNFPQCTFD